jgi:hypothetical protein
MIGREPGARSRSHRFHSRMAALAVTVALLIPVVVAAEQYLPLTIGNQWVYQGVAGKSERQLVTEMRTFWGSDTYVISYLDSSSNQGLENYWTTDADGDVSLWGFYNATNGEGILYTPPIKRVDAPLYVGKTWSTTFDYYFLPGMTYGGTATIVMSDWEERILVVPAGPFPTVGVGQGPYDGPLRGYSLAGLRVSAVPVRGASDWYSPSVGLVQYQSDDLYQLTSFGGPTPAVQSTWGRVKALYR